MTSKPHNWKRLFETARSLLSDEDIRHDNSCGCQDDGDTVVEGPCPGLKERKRFLERTARFVKGGTSEPRKP